MDLQQNMMRHEGEKNVEGETEANSSNGFVSYL